MEIKGIGAVITGGASGLGAATAKAIAAAGGRVAILDLDPEKGRALQAELKDAAMYFQLDVVRNQDVESTIEKAKEKLGGIHAVINCAGLGGSQKILGKEGIMPVEWFATRVDINVLGTFHVIRAALPFMVENEANAEGERGVIINTASVAATDGQIGQSAYAASKGGIVSMTLPLARELANNGIRVMAIMPGIMDTPLLARNPAHILERLAKQVPFPPRLGKAAEFAKLACHIIDNPYLNGESIRLDGGLRMGFGRK